MLDLIDSYSEVFAVYRPWVRHDWKVIVISILFSIYLGNSSSM